MIVVRPSTGHREIRDKGELTIEGGLGDDRWSQARRPNPERQLTIINTRAIDLVAGTQERWPLSGDQLFVDLDLSEANLPIGSQLKIGNAVVEISTAPHVACDKFIERFGADALKFTNCLEGMRMRLRGVNTRVVQSGAIQVSNNVTPVD